ncbi:hypothetical protein [Thermomonas aquatica]|uniref:Uncharacterized protein n=1 Tax=Thermomonas aquatica TaxID=2202149 RepID=A0A5B7ZNB4_9GAMM|nr:hypothetical protein [Thermomonas aquatica]QDA56448.1 hypothetical protein FHQ07_03540 [Thermomonas aquatica]
MSNLHLMNFLELIGNTLFIVGFLALPVALLLAHRRERSRLSLWLVIVSFACSLSVIASIAGGMVMHTDWFRDNAEVRYNSVVHGVVLANGLLTLYSASLALILLAVSFWRTGRKA